MSEETEALTGWKNFYDTQYKKLLWIPALMFAVALFLIFLQYAQTGDFLYKDISLKGGLTVTVFLEKDISIDALAQDLQRAYPTAEVSVRSLTSLGNPIGFIVDSDIDGSQEANIEALISTLSSAVATPLTEDMYTVEFIGSSLGASFFKETFFALLMAFVFMGIVVFLYFRLAIPSMAVILAAFSDIVVTLAIVNLLGIRLSTAGIAAFLMLIGYSVDTDLLLSTKLLKHKEGSLMKRLMEATKTGMTMTATTLVTVTLAMIFSQSEVIRQIMIILFIGLLVDVINTWIQNVGILRIYLERKEKHALHHESQS